MMQRVISRGLGSISWSTTRRTALLGATLVLTLPACGGAVASGAATAKVGQDLSARADMVPQGAEACALKDALAAPSAAPDKPLSDTCNKALKSDQVWQRSMIVLGAYSDTLGEMASGAGGDSTGVVQGALAGVRGSTWIETDDPAEKAALTAMGQLVDQMSNGSAKGDLSKAVKDAAPHVKAICNALPSYLGTQAQSFADIEKELEKKRTAHQDRRCGTLDTRSICVSESVVDRAAYGDLFAHLAALESGHLDAQDAVKGFCAAHLKLEDAAAKGDLSNEKTLNDVVDAVRSAHRAQRGPSSSPTKK